MPGPDYVEEKVKCKEFLEGYDGAISDDEEGDDVGVRQKKYMKLLQKVANRRENTVEIKLDDVADYIEDDLLANIQKNTRRYAMLFAEAIDELLPRPTEDGGEESVFDVLMRQRRRADGAEEGQEPAAPDPANQLPPEMRRTYEVRIIPQTKMKAMAIREVKAADIGHLVTIKGIITRCTDVKPLMSVATYTCDECGFEIYQEVTARQFMPLHECPSIRCRSNNARGQLQLQTRGSKFVKFQEARIQEMSEQVPKGHIPRTMTIHIRGELTRKVGPGDVVSVSGIFLPVPYTGFRAMRAGLVADTFLEATSIRQMKKRYQEYQLDAETQAEVETLAEEGDVYARLSRSIAPEIYGHEDVKKALLLLLVGGTTKQLKDGMKIRGDLHVCLMGDPGVAKSQLLKQICVVAPRAVYTTGKGSSGVGLTAAVTRDTVTNEMVLEGGALVLADMGICCIDEFDKMEESDRTAIHEVMEQQTVSIAKAGITTTLNARTSVLAAANPAWGRYDLRRSPAENINLPPALLSRFDLLWLILDRADSEADLRLAQHVLHVHQNNKAPDLEFNPLSAHVLRAYISLARQYEPVIPRELTEYIAGAYATLRQEEAASEAPTTYTTARTLLSTIRLSQALARLRFSRAVQQSDVDEALRLMQMSKMSLQDDEARRSGLDPISDVYTILRDEAKKKDTIHIQYTDALNWITRKGYNQQQLDECLEEYAALNVWQVHPTTKDVHFIDTN